MKEDRGKDEDRIKSMIIEHISIKYLDASQEDIVQLFQVNQLSDYFTLKDFKKMYRKKENRLLKNRFFTWFDELLRDYRGLTNCDIEDLTLSR